MIENKPVIGIAYSDCALRDNEMRIRTYVSRKYYHAIQRSGGIALLIPAPYTDSFSSDEEKQKINIEHSKAYLKLVDGIIFAGGEDIDPAYQNEDPSPMLGSTNPFRDEFEVTLCQEAYNQEKSMLGICRGIQLMAIALGGSIYQDISKIEKVKHSQLAPRWQPSHRIILSDDSVLSKCNDSSQIMVNSFHHQAVKELPEGFKVVAKASDGIIEAIEAKNGKGFCLGVQWHPEETFNTYEFSRKIFSWFINKANI